MHQLSHSHWAQLHDDKSPAARESDGLPNWKDAPPVRPALAGEVG